MKEKRYELKLTKSRYGLIDEIIKRVEEIFFLKDKEINEIKPSLGFGTVLHMCILRDEMETIRYILTGEEIPKRD